MTGDCHVRICGSRGVKFLPATRPSRHARRPLLDFLLASAEMSLRRPDVRLSVRS